MSPHALYRVEHSMEHLSRLGQLFGDREEFVQKVEWNPESHSGMRLKPMP